MKYQYSITTNKEREEKMDNLTKESVKKRLIVSFVLAVLWTVIMLVLGMFKDSLVLIVILAPVLMTWEFTTLLFFPKEFLNNVILPPLKMWLHLFTFRIGEALSDLIQPLVWGVKTLIKSIKVIFWAFSKE